MTSESQKNIPLPGERFKCTLLSLAKMMSGEMNLARSRGIKTIEPAIIEFGIELIKNTDGDNITGGFITRSFDKSNGYWDKILEKNENFFLSKENSNLLFGELSSGIIDGFIDIIEKQTNDKLMVSLWNHLHAMIKISIAFIYFEREPQKYKTEDGFAVKYTKKIRNHINLENEATKWGIDLMKVK